MPAHDPTMPYCYWAHQKAAIVTDTIERSRKRGRPITRHEIMAMFDRLPAEVRQTLANADHPWAPSWCAEVRELWGGLRLKLLSGPPRRIRSGGTAMNCCSRDLGDDPPPQQR